MSYMYHPEIAAVAVEELTQAMRGLTDMDYANALLSDPRMTNTKGILASCGFSYKGIRFVRERVPGDIPTLEAQRRALDFLRQIDDMQHQKLQVAS